MLKKKRLNKAPGNIGRKIFITTAILVLFGIVMIYNVSAAEAFRDFSDRFYYLKHQSLWALIGFFLLLILAKIKTSFWRKIAIYLYVANLIFLVLVLLPGIGSHIQGSSRWLAVGSFIYQPSETMKLLNILYLSIWLEKKRSLRDFLLLAALPSFLVLLEPDLGTAFIIFSCSLFVYFLSGESRKNIIYTVGLIGFLGTVFMLSSSYRRDRLTSFMDPTKDPQGISYHVNQVLMALANGGIFGVGLGESRQKYLYLPEAPTDSIFAVIAEEFGFLGAFALLFTFLYFIFLLFRAAQRVKDRYGRILVASLSAWLGLQIVLNLAAMLALIPLTGLPLPFISYGGSSLLVNMAAIGIIIGSQK